MSPLAAAILLPLAAGLCALAGAALARFDEARGGLLSPGAGRAVLAFGGGALIAAVGLVLAPDGIDKQPVWLGLSSFLAGGAVFAAIDSALAKSGAPLSMLVAMMMDFAPESLVLGAVAAADPAQAVFLAVVIGAQNLPEGFNAYREIRSAHAAYLSRHVMRFMAICSLAGPAAAVVGLYAFAPDSPALGFVMTFCAGGVLYLVMRDIAPRAGDGPDWWPAYGAVAGFGVGLAGHAVIG